MSSTPGFRRMLARAWGVLLDTKHGMRFVLGFHALTILFLEMRNTSREHVEEFIEGAGGRLSDLALVVVGYVDSTPAGDDPDAVTLKGDMSAPGHVFDFVNDVDMVLSPKPNAHGLGPFSMALLSQEIVGSVTALAYVLTRPDSRFEAFPPFLHKSLEFLNRVIPAAPAHHPIIDAL